MEPVLVPMQSEHSLRRAVLFSARLRFSSPVQPLREAAIDRIVLQNLALLDEEAYVSREGLFDRGAFLLPDGTEILTVQQVDEALERLVNVAALEASGDGSFRLSDDARIPLEAESQRNQQLFDLVIERHLEGARGGAAQNRDVFIAAVGTLFAELGEIYARTILGELEKVDFARGPLVKRILDSIASWPGEHDLPAIQTGLVSFIEDLRPDAAHVKWNLAQNYYVAKALGLDQEGLLLSEEAFGEAEIYLDTNVVIPALEPRARHHRSFMGLASACKAVGAQLTICAPTVQETRSSMANQRDVVEKVVDDVPEELEKRIKGDFFLLARDIRRKEGEVDLDEMFSAYQAPAEILEEKYGVELVDDEWFTQGQNLGEVQALKILVNDAWARIAGRPKSDAVALHDALLLGWVGKRRKDEPNRLVLLITRDHTLPTIRLPATGETPRAMMLDAFIQWVSPLVLRGNPNTDFSSIFADAIKYELLPQENFFDPKDFLVFHEMEMSCKELPVEDVEACLLHLRRNMGRLDPRRAEDREKLSAEIHKFLVSPGRKYRQDLGRLEEEKAELERKAAEKLAQTEADVAAARREVEENQSTIKDFEEKERVAQENAARASLRRSAIRRLVFLSAALLGTILLLVVNALASAAPRAAVFGTIMEALPAIVLAGGGFVLAGWFFLGRERIRALGWGAEKLFKAD